MKQEKTPYQSFLDATELNFQGLVKEYEKRIDKARVGFKKKAHSEFWYYIIRDEHLSIQRDLGKYAHFVLNIKDEMENDKDTELDVLFNQKIAAATDTDSEILLQNLSKLQAVNNLIEYLKEEGKKYKDKQPSQIPYKKPATNLYWKGKPGELVQLVYGAHESGCLGNKKDQITTLVEEFAELVNCGLGDHWQSNLSKSVNNRKAGYKPKIFKKMEDGFEIHRQRLINTDK